MGGRVKLGGAFTGAWSAVAWGAVVAGALVGGAGCEDAQRGTAEGGAGSDGGFGGSAGGGGAGGGGLEPGPSGSIDATFGEAGIVRVDFGAVDTAWGVAVDPHGRVVLGGNSDASVSTFAIARLDDDGALDQAFGTFGQVATSFDNDYDGAEAILMQPDGRFIAAGTTFSTDVINGVSGFALARYTDDGTLDTTFGDGGQVVTDLWGTQDLFSLGQAAVLQPDGRTVVVGSGTEIVLARYTAAGKLDTSFGAGGVATAHVSDTETGTAAAHVALDAAGRLLVAGRHIDDLDAETGFVARFTSAGALDGSFGSGGFSLVPLPTDGQLTVVAAHEELGVIAGGVSDGRWVVARFDDTGALVSDFGEGGVLALDLPAKQPTGLTIVGGDVVVTGTFASSPGSCPCVTSGCDNRCGFLGAVRVSSAGAVAADFGEGGVLAFPVSADDYITSATLDAAGRVIVAGHTEATSGQDFLAVRFWP